MYPLLRDGVSLGTLLDDYGQPDGYYAENDRGETYEIDAPIYRLLDMADGRHDFYAQGIPKKTVDELLPWMKQARLITTSRLNPGFPFGRLVLFTVGDRANRYKGFCTACNRVLPLAALVLFLAGVPGLGRAFSLFRWDYPFLPLVGLLLLSLVLHEGGHLCAAVAYGCQVADGGILLLGSILPAGGYISQSSPRTRGQRIQSCLAGLEVSFALAGLCALLAFLPGEAGRACATTCVWNLIVGLCNLLPAGGMDGEQALSAFLRLPSFSEFAAAALRSPQARRMLFHGGLEGFFWLAVFVFQFVCRLSMVLLFGAGLYIGWHLA